MTRDIGTLPAHGTVTIPMRITRLAGTPDGQASTKLLPLVPGLMKAPPVPTPGAPCNVNFGLDYDYPCGPFGVYESVTITVLNVSGDCTSRPGVSGYSVGCVNCGGGSGYGFPYIPSNPGSGRTGVVSVPPSFSLPPSCDPCYQAVIDCAIGAIPVVGCVYSVFKTCVPEAIGTIQTGTGTGKTVEDCTFTIIGCLPGGTIPSCIQTLLSCKCPSDQSVTECGLNLLRAAAVRRWSGHQSLAPASSSPPARAAA